MQSNWVVVLEVVRCPSASSVDAHVLERLLEVLCEAEASGAEPLALLTKDRYALHLSVTADHVAEAISIAVFRWENVSRQLCLDGWEARRAEVITKADFEAESHRLAGCRGWRPGAGAG